MACTGSCIWTLSNGFWTSSGKCSQKCFCVDAVVPVDPADPASADADAIQFLDATDKKLANASTPSILGNVSFEKIRVSDKLMRYRIDRRLKAVGTDVTKIAELNKRNSNAHDLLKKAKKALDKISSAATSPAPAVTTVAAAVDPSVELPCMPRQ